MKEAKESPRGGKLSPQKRGLLPWRTCQSCIGKSKAGGDFKKSKERRSWIGRVGGGRVSLYEKQKVW